MYNLEAQIETARRRERRAADFAAYLSNTNQDARYFGGALDRWIQACKDLEILIQQLDCWNARTR